ncbi:hypothetical protein VW35_00895 [Devosia soli]|uniref:Uncharacterized protein n=1 Tax=Devosia soli TaxID=361041 RepID=A0A0F5LEL3_9HYPH|nr:hypothetical protein [Devosia soli]KKB80798.1 hypothetical protein VW35_00895 [Devosia soli]
MIKVIQDVPKWLHAYLRSLYPFLVCFVGGLVLMAHDELGGIAAMVIAGLCFAWGLDLAAARAEAKATEHTAAKLTSMLISGDDTTVTVDINHHSPAFEHEMNGKTK